MEISKEEIFQKICSAIRFDNFGMFLGSGFSKALFEDDEKEGYSWGELLHKVCDYYPYIQKESIFDKRASYPEIASKIVSSIDVDNQFISAEQSFKGHIAHLINKTISQKTIDKWHDVFVTIVPSFVITTNYDTIFEQLFPGSSLTINSYDSFYNIKELIPVYHIHGCVNDPESIVITNEDYSKTLRISDYRHLRLPFLLKENTILMVGYSLTDFNVLSAIDYCNNVYGDNHSPFEGKLIQVIRNKNISETKSYINDNKIIVIETNDLYSFFTELKQFYNNYTSSLEENKKKIDGLYTKYSNYSEDNIRHFVNNRTERKEDIKTIMSIDLGFGYVFQSFFPFIKNVMSSLWVESQKPKNFRYYKIILEILLDIVENMKQDRTPINFLNYLSDVLVIILNYLGDQMGDAWDATSEWKSRKKCIPNWFILHVIQYKSENIYGKASEFLNELLV